MTAKRPLSITVLLIFIAIRAIWTVNTLWDDIALVQSNGWDAAPIGSRSMSTMIVYELLVVLLSVLTFLVLIWRHSISRWFAMGYLLIFALECTYSMIVAVRFQQSRGTPELEMFFFAIFAFAVIVFIAWSAYRLGFSPKNVEYFSGNHPNILLNTDARQEPPRAG